MKIVITGGCGFLGSNLAKYGADKGFDVHLIDNLSRLGSSANLKWLEDQSPIKFHYGDVRNFSEVQTLVQKINPDAIFHVAGQVAMTTSIQNPMNDMAVNLIGTLNLLEVSRVQSKRPVIIYSSTNKVYGDLDNYQYTETATRYKCEDFENGISEDTPLDFRSPYGCSKGAADQYTLDYGRTYGLQTVVFRHSSMYGGRQFSTVDQGWVGWFCSQAKKQKAENIQRPILISGTGKQVRDLLHAEDMCRLYYGALEQIDTVAGNAFNIGGGRKNSMSILELFQYLERKLNIEIQVEKQGFRQSDQKIFIANLSKIQKHINWTPNVSFNDGLDKFLDWLE